ncbi:MAG TPA: hypothetical protein VKU41_31315 [Polyangiaceae bacterium]|nr:hypothetical protein [Polyangiaceae bacterium]
MLLAPRFHALAVAVAAVTWVHPSFAQDTEATATALFDEGRKLMTQHRYADACPKLAQSQRLAPSGGTLINLAECYEHTGQTASAWAAWKDAAARANAAGKSAAEKNALARAAALEGSLAKLTIAVSPGSDVPGLEVKRDGVPVGRAEFGNAMPVDPGSHLVEASAPKKKAFSSSVTVAPKQADAQVTVALADDAEALAAAPAPAPAPSLATPAATTTPSAPVDQGTPGATQRVVGLVVGGVGVAGLVVGSVFGLEAQSKNSDALKPQNCRTSTLCSPNGLSLTDDAKNAATISTVAFVAGGVAVAAGAVIWLTAPRAAASTGLRAVPVVGLGYGGVAVGGGF